MEEKALFVIGGGTGDDFGLGDGLEKGIKKKEK